MLVLVVGPSGAGKDTLLDAARRALARDRRFRFVRRAITRPAEAGFEAHEALNEAEFAVRERAGGFALAWRAHGLAYGIPADIGVDLTVGRVVIANVSRAVLAEATTRFPTRIIEVTAGSDVLARRLAARGRESAAEISARLSRAAPHVVADETTVNDGDLAEAVENFLGALNRAAGSARPAERAYFRRTG